MLCSESLPRQVGPAMLRSESTGVAQVPQPRSPAYVSGGNYQAMDIDADRLLRVGLEGSCRPTADNRARTFNARLTRARTITSRDKHEVDAAERAHMKSANQYTAVRADDCFGDDGHLKYDRRAKAQRMRDGSVGAFWKRWLPTTCLRACFWSMNMPARQAAKVYHSGSHNCTASHRHIRESRCSVTQVYDDWQHQQLSEFDARHLEEKHTWLVYQIQFDETRLCVQTGTSDDTAAAPNLWSIMQQHGHLTWEDPEKTVHSQDVLFAPSALAEGTADCMWAALEAKHRSCLPTLLDSAHRRALVFSSDAAAVNRKVMKYIASLFPSTLVLWTKCAQHQVGLILAALCLALGLAGPLFCCAKQLRMGDTLMRVERALKAILTKELRYIDDDSEVPLSEHVAKLDAVLKCTICRPVFDLDNPDEIAHEDKHRKREADAIKRMFTGNVDDQVPVHHCRLDPATGRRCCRDRKDAVDNMTRAITGPLRRRLVVPATNKWTTVDPVAVILCIMVVLHKLFPRALLWIVGRDTDTAHESDTADDKPEKTPQNRDRRKSFKDHLKTDDADRRKRDRRRARRMREWLTFDSTKQNLVLWCTLCGKLMRLHWFLFATGALHRTSSNGYTGLTALTRPDLSPAVQVLTELNNCMEWAEDAASFWAPMIAIFGPFAVWPPSLLMSTQVCVNIAVGNLYRRLIMPFIMGWPWKLSRVCDPDVPMEERRRLAREFWSANECCIDPLFGERLRKSIDHWEALFEPDMQSFLRCCFHTSSATTVNVEQGFARLRRWLSSLWRAPHLSTMCWYHVASHLKSVHARWMRPRTADPPPKYHTESMRRPIWAGSKRRRGSVSGGEKGEALSAQNTYVSTRVSELRIEQPRDRTAETADAYHKRLFAQASREYRSIDDEAKREYSVAAAVENNSRRDVSDPLEVFVEELDDAANVALPDSKPWGIACREFPVGQAFWRGTVAAFHRRWKSKRRGALSGLKTQRSQNTSVSEHKLIDRQTFLNKGFGNRRGPAA